MLYSLVLDDRVAGSGHGRSRERYELDTRLDAPFDPGDRERYERERYLSSPEAIAASEDDFWADATVGGG